MSNKSHPEEGLSQANVSSDEKAIYEVGFHVSPTLLEDQIINVVEKIKNALGQSEIISQEAPIRVPLAYTIEIAHAGKRAKYNEAYFGWVKFEADREIIPALEQVLRTTPDIIRHLLIHTVREDAAATPRRAVFSSDRLEGETIQKPVETPEAPVEVSEAELDKSIDALVA